MSTEVTSNPEDTSRAARELATIMPTCRKFQDSVWNALMEGQNGWLVLRIQVKDGKVTLVKTANESDVNLGNRQDGT